MQKSHPEMALKHQFGTSPEASLTQRLIQTEKIKANLEIRAKGSVKNPFFPTMERKQPGLSVDKKVSFPKHLGYENLAEPSARRECHYLYPQNVVCLMNGG